MQIGQRNSSSTYLFHPGKILTGSKPKLSVSGWGNECKWRQEAERRNSFFGREIPKYSFKGKHMKLSGTVKEFSACIITASLFCE